ncbi:MAG: Ribosomal L32p protein family [Candidatus Parcubacteria bacterium]|jgi:ribosomal protein L32
MAGVPVKHHTHGKVGRRRSHLALKKTRLVVCLKCGGPARMHQSCLQCGAYPAKKDRSALRVASSTNPSKSHTSTEDGDANVSTDSVHAPTQSP